jgi:hypothetical protein
MGVALAVRLRMPPETDTADGVMQVPLPPWSVGLDE